MVIEAQSVRIAAVIAGGQHLHPGSSSEAQIAENYDILDFELSGTEMEQIAVLRKIGDSPIIETIAKPQASVLFVYLCFRRGIEKQKLPLLIQRKRSGNALDRIAGAFIIFYVILSSAKP